MTAQIIIGRIGFWACVLLSFIFLTIITWFPNCPISIVVTVGAIHLLVSVGTIGVLVYEDRRQRSKGFYWERL